MENYLNILAESLDKKIKLLEKIQDYNKCQEEAFSSSKIKLEDFDRAIEEKGNLIEEINRLDEEVKLHDPWIALDGKEDGLYFYRLIVKDSIRYLNKGGYILFEIGFDQGKDVSELLKNEGYEEIEIKKDLAGLDRVVMGRYNKE